MKRSNHILVLLCSFMILVSCKTSPDENPVVPNIPEEIEFSSDSHILIFNALKEDREIQIAIDQSQSSFSVMHGEHSNYYLLAEGEIEIEVKEPMTSAVLLTKKFDLEGGYFYSAFFFRNQDEEYDLLLSKDYDETERVARNGSPSINFIAVNLSKNFPFETMSIFNDETNRSNPMGDIAVGIVRTWIDDLSYGKSQKNDDAHIGNIANQVIVASGEATQSTISTENSIVIDRLIGYIITTRWNLGPGSGVRTGDFVNTKNFESNKTYIFVAFDHHIFEDKTDGVILELNGIDIIG